MPPTGSIKTGAEYSARMLFSRAPPAQSGGAPLPAYGWMATRRQSWLEAARVKPSCHFSMG
jgi:hypothetical protein